MTVALLSLACWCFHISRIADRLGYDTGRGVVHLCWTCLKTCLELPKSRYLVSLYSDLMDQFEGSMITCENIIATRESSHVIILKSRLKSTGHSAARARFWTFLIVRPMYPMTDDSWCARTFSNFEPATIQWRRPSVILQKNGLTKTRNVHMKIYILWIFSNFILTYHRIY